MTLAFIDSALPRPLAPQPSAFSRPFWDALEQGRLTATSCPDCQQIQFPPRPQCPHCRSGSMQWIELSGRARLYSATRIHAAGGPFACMTPYSVGLVDLAEGVRVLTRLLHDSSSLPPGSALELVVVKHTDGLLFAACAAN